jgi:hypothetical protein
LLTLSCFHSGWIKYVRVLSISEMILKEESRNTKPVPASLFSPSFLVHNDVTASYQVLRITFNCAWLQASSTNHIRDGLLQVTTQLLVVLSHRRFGQPTGLICKGPIGYLDTSAINYHCSPCNNPQEGNQLTLNWQHYITNIVLVVWIVT